MLPSVATSLWRHSHFVSWLMRCKLKTGESSLRALTCYNLSVLCLWPNSNSQILVLFSCLSPSTNWCSFMFHAVVFSLVSSSKAHKISSLRFQLSTLQVGKYLVELGGCFLFCRRHRGRYVCSHVTFASDYRVLGDRRVTSAEKLRNVLRSSLAREAFRKSFSFPEICFVFFAAVENVTNISRGMLMFGVGNKHAFYLFSFTWQKPQPTNPTLFTF